MRRLPIVALALFAGLSVAGCDIKTSANGNLSFDIAKGEIVAVLGKTGCGKSTMFNLLSGLIEPTSGKVDVTGHNPFSEFNFFRGKIGIVFQNDRLMPWRNAIDNVVLGLEILDRKKDVIISGGENVSSIEVEDAVFSHPDVAEVAVIGIPDDKWGELVLALVVKTPGSSLTEADLIAHVRTKLAGYKCPKRIEFRVPDPSANPYLAFAAMLMAGLDGIKNKIEPPAPIDKDLYELPPDEHADINTVPASLDAVLERANDLIFASAARRSARIPSWP